VNFAVAEDLLNLDCEGEATKESLYKQEAFEELQNITGSGYQIGRL
jgi:hypothetical protein